MILIVPSLTNCYSQKQADEKILALLGTWYKGHVILPEAALDCLIRYNDLEGILVFKAHDDPDNIKTLKAPGVIRFNYFDSAQQHSRFFVSLPYDAQKNGTMTSIFFEILKEYRHFALLSAKLPLEVIKKFNPAMLKYPNMGPNIFFQHREVLSIISDEGHLRDYMEITVQDRSRKPKVKEQIINANLLQEYLGNSFAQLQEFSNKNKLSFKKKEDLLVIFNYYDKIKIE